MLYLFKMDKDMGHEEEGGKYMKSSGRRMLTLVALLVLPIMAAVVLAGKQTSFAEILVLAGQGTVMQEGEEVEFVIVAQQDDTLTEAWHKRSVNGILLLGDKAYNLQTGMVRDGESSCFCTASGAFIAIDVDMMTGAPVMLIVQEGDPCDFCKGNNLCKIPYEQNITALVRYGCVPNPPGLEGLIRFEPRPRR